MKTARRERMTSKGMTRKGMTLIEVMIAITILAGAMLAIAAFMGKFAHVVSVSDVRNTASEIASKRLEDIKTAPRYSMVDSLFPATMSLTSPYVGYTVNTTVSHTGGTAQALYDYKTVTVVVKNGRLDAPLKRSTIIAAF